MTPGERLLLLIEQEHAKPLRTIQRNLLKGIPNEGGRFSREVLREMIRTAFIEGVMSQRFKHAGGPGKN